MRSCPRPGAALGLCALSFAIDVAAQEPPAAPPPPAPPPPAYAPPPAPMVPYAPPPAPPEEGRYSTGMIVTGIIATSLSIPALSFGSLFLVAAGNVQCGPCAQDEPCTCSDSGSARGATIVMIGGSVLLAAGIPLIIVGARKVPKESAQASAPPVLLIGPGAVSLQCSF